MAILYSFRRCPFAIRARLAIVLSGATVELREVVLRNKPSSMLAYSPKGTVPVLIDGDIVIDESVDVMRWSLDRSPWCEPSPDDEQLIEQNDTVFKPLLDRYKYAERHPEKSRDEHRALASRWLETLDSALVNDYLAGDAIGFADVALAPFVRQFASVDRGWFDAQPWTDVHAWLARILDSAAFETTMTKYSEWAPALPEVYFPKRS